MGNETRPRIIKWESNATHDLVIAEHYGYQSLPAGAITHRRTVRFEKTRRQWLIEDELTGFGKHDFKFVFHAAPGREVRVIDNAQVEILDPESGARLVVASLNSLSDVKLERAWASRAYGAKEESVRAVWRLEASAPVNVGWALIVKGEEL
jgi:hypothetical protein